MEKIDRYNLLCGGVYRYISKSGRYQTELYQEHSVYHVRSFDENDIKYRTYWKSFPTLTEAKKAYRSQYSITRFK